MRVNLSCIESDFMAVLIPMKSGITWVSQVGGTACGHPEVEGIYVPVRDCSPSGKRDDPLYDRYELEYKTDLVHEFLKRDDYLIENFLVLDIDFPTWTGTNMRLAEAWIPVRIAKYPTEPTLEEFASELAVLTYRNSD